jgi:putative two-component system response regulator
MLFGNKSKQQKTLAEATEKTTAALETSEPRPTGSDESAEIGAGLTRVLVADGNPTVRKILRHLFSTLGWETLEAVDGRQAVERARQRPQPHALILDMDLKEVSGYDVCRTLKNADRTQMIPIIALTAHDSSEEKTRALEAGADDLLSKPINRAELSLRLRSLLRIHRFNQEMIGAESVALALARAVAAKDGYAHSHLEKVAAKAVKFGQTLGMDETDLKILKYGAILHNVGKIAIPDAVLEKTGGLTPREMALFQQHPRVGCDICSPLKPLQRVLPIIRHHKEHWDGTGYPDGLRGEAIPLGAQIVGIVDVYTALISDRPYRKAVSHEEAVASLQRQATEGKHNPQLVDQFIQFLSTDSAGDSTKRESATNEPSPDTVAALVTQPVDAGAAMPQQSTQ